MHSEKDTSTTSPFDSKSAFSDETHKVDNSRSNTPISKNPDIFVSRITRSVNRRELGKRKSLEDDPSEQGQTSEGRTRALAKRKLSDCSLMEETAQAGFDSETTLTDSPGTNCHLHVVDEACEQESKKSDNSTSYSQASTSCVSLSNAHFWPVEEYCRLVLSAEVVENGVRKLDRIVHMPLDPDILLWVFKAKHNFCKPSYSALNKVHDFEQVHTFKLSQAKRQIFYFSHLIRKGIYTNEQLKQKVRPYVTAQTGKRVLARAMLHDNISVIGTKEGEKMKASQFVERFVNHCADIDPTEAEAEARSTGGPDINTFISSIKNIHKMGASTPFESRRKAPLPEVEYDVIVVPLSVTSRNREKGQGTTSQSRDANTLSKRSVFKTVLRSVESHEGRIQLLLATYSKNQLLCILYAFLSQMQERVSRNALNAIKNSDAAAALARLLIISLETRLGDLNAQDYLGSQIWAKVVESSKRHTAALNRNHPQFGPRKSKRALTTRSFWRLRAKTALCRERGERNWVHEESGKKDIEKFSIYLRHMFEEQARLCRVCKVMLTTHGARAWTNGSIDRVVPAVRGGRYVEGNVQIVCAGCNAVKYWYTLESAQILIGELADTPLILHGNLLCAPRLKAIRAIQEKEMDRIVRPWCSQRLRNTYITRKMDGEEWQYKDKGSTLQLSDLIEMVEASWVGDGFVQDVSGLQAPLGSIGIDKIDPNGGYRRENVRLLVTGLNLLKSDSPDDLRAIGYLSHLKSSQHVREQAANARNQGHLLPLQRTMMRLLSQTSGISNSLRRIRELEVDHLREHCGDDQLENDGDDDNHERYYDETEESDEELLGEDQNEEQEQCEENGDSL